MYVLSRKSEMELNTSIKTGFKLVTSIVCKSTMNYEQFMSAVVRKSTKLTRNAALIFTSCADSPLRIARAVQRPIRVERGQYAIGRALVDQEAGNIENNEIFLGFLRGSRGTKLRFWKL